MRPRTRKIPTSHQIHSGSRRRDERRNSGARLPGADLTGGIGGGQMRRAAGGGGRGNGEIGAGGGAGGNREEEER